MSGESGTETGALQNATAAANAQPNEPVEKGATNCPTSPPPLVCPNDFLVDAPVRILHADGAPVFIKALDFPDVTGGIFTWRTSSKNIRLSIIQGRKVAVWGVGNSSSARDAEVVEVTRTGYDCSPITKTVLLTVARVTFGPSAKQKYGYDDFDARPPWTPKKRDLHYLSIRESDNTWVEVTIEGGLLGTDFVLDRIIGRRGPFLFGPMQGSAKFDLLLYGGEAQRLQILQVKCKTSGTLFSELGICVYKRKDVNVVIGKFGPTADKGSLEFPEADYASHQTAANSKLREGVVRYELFNLFSDNGVAEVEFQSGTDRLTFDIRKGGGPDVDAIKRIMSGRTKRTTGLVANVASMTRVAVVRRMVSYYHLECDANAKDTILHVGSDHFYTVGQTVTLGKGADARPVNIVAVDADAGTITCAKKVGREYPQGTPITFPAGAWSSDPIIIQEGDAKEETAKWTILHEVGHRALELFDVRDATNFMNGNQGNHDNRLRYCPRENYRDKGEKENQWERIPRG